jgi:hypothetical protein
LAHGYRGFSPRLVGLGKAGHPGGRSVAGEAGYLMAARKHRGEEQRVGDPISP